MRTVKKKSRGESAGAAKYICIACDLGHVKPVKACTECGCGAVGEQPDPLNDAAFPLGRKVIGWLGMGYPGLVGSGIIRGTVESLAQKGWNRRVIIRAQHNDQRYPVKFSDVLWEIER